MNKRKELFRMFIAILPLVLLLFVIYTYKDTTTVATEGEAVYEGSIEQAGKLLNSGDEISVKFNVKNITGNKKEGIEVKLICDGESKVIGKNPMVIELLQPNEEGKIDWKVECKSGGTKFIAQVKDKNKGIKNIELGGITVNDKGWFLGDNHTHTKYSDGSGSVSENIWAMRSKGLSYMTLTDHNNSNGYDESKSVKGEGELIIKGNEFSSGSGHAVMMNVKDNKNYGSLSKDNLIKEVENYNTLIYAAHPCFNAIPWKLEDYKGLNGIEVWNGSWGPKNKFNKDAFELWDKLNKDGNHLYGVGESDAHSPNEIGNVYLKTYADKFDLDSIIEGQKKGHMYGTNGPSLDIRVNNAMMGDDYKIASMGEIVKVNLKGSYYGGISKVRLIRNGEVISDKEINDVSFNIVERVRVAPGDFVRMEVDGKEEEGLSLSTENGYKNTAPFAFSNPIFMVEK